MKIKKKIYVFGLTLCLLFVSIFASAFRVGASSSFVFEGYEVYDSLESVESYGKYNYITYSEMYNNIILEEKGIDFYSDYNFSFLSLNLTSESNDFLNYLTSNFDGVILRLFEFSEGLTFIFSPSSNEDYNGLVLFDNDFAYLNEILESGNINCVIKGDGLGFLKEFYDLSSLSRFEFGDLECLDIRFYYADLDYGITETLFSSVSKVVSELANTLVQGAIQIFAPGGQLSNLSIIILSFVGVSIAFALVGLVLYLVKLKR